MKLNHPIAFLILFSAFFFITSLAFAQNIPPTEQPGAQTGRLQTELEQKKQEFKEQKPQTPKITVEHPPEKPPAEKITFVLKGVTVTGATVFDLKEFIPIYESTLGKTVTFDDLQVMVEKIKAQYRQAGYATTTVYVPEQDIAAGIVEIRVAEGRMGALRMEGNRYTRTALLERYFHTKQNELLNIKKIQKDILRINQNPDLEAKIVITAGQDPSISDVVLKLEEEFPHHIGFGTDNQGTRLLGLYRGSQFYRSSNFTGREDSLYVGTLFNSRSAGQSLSYLLPINTYGTKLGMDITDFTMKLGQEFKSFDITGNSQIYVPHVNLELYLDEDTQASADMGLEIKSIKRKNSSETTASDQLRLPYLGFEFTQYNLAGGTQTTWAPRLTFGTENFLGASSRNHPSAGRAGTGGFFFRYGHTLRRLQRMPWQSYLSIRSQFQVASHTLASSEQLQLGGGDSIRGYPQGDYMADTGGNLNLEWIFPSYFIPERWRLPSADVSLRHQVEMVTFVDVGGGKLKKVIPGEEGAKFLASAGGGLRFRVARDFYLQLQWAKPIRESPISGAGPSTFSFTFQIQR